MELKTNKKIKDLHEEVLLKSIDLDKDIEEFQVNIGTYSRERVFNTVAPECIRCNLCVEECPVNAISSSSAIRKAKIQDNCVSCDICAQTCPISAISIVKIESQIEDDVSHKLTEITLPHRKLKLKNIEVKNEKCAACGTCVKFCPTSAIFIEADEDETKLNKFNEKEFSHINEKLCIGCGACANVCNENAITLERELGPINTTKELILNQLDCVNCLICEESCPMEAIKLIDGEIQLDKDKCILCEVCSSKCPVNALILRGL